MSIFRNENESAYVGGRKHWTDVIKNSGSGELLLWRQPEEDFNTNSTLIVMPGEQAIFINNGTIEEVFSEGRYKLNTQNYPFISRLRNAFSGGVSTFNCVVYFVRMADSKEIIWGVNSPIKVRDKVYNIQTDVRVRGSYKVRIKNPQLFLEHMVGNNVNIQTQEGLEEYFSNEFQSKFRSVISRFLNALQQELIGLDAYLDEVSDRIQPYINESLTEYGIECVKFSLAALDVETEKYDQIDASQIGLITTARSAQGEYLKTVTDAEAQKATVGILGEDWSRVKATDILTDIANNPGAGGYATMGAGLGMGMAAGGMVNGLSQQAFAPMSGQMQGQPQQQPQQGGTSGRFQQQNASAQQNQTQQPVRSSGNASADYVNCLAELMKKYQSGEIDEQTYQFLKAEINKSFGIGG